MRTIGLAALAALLAVSAPQPATGPPPTPVWIDTDPAVGEPDRDVDDGLALLQAFNSPELTVRGVSVVFGNTTLDRAWPIGVDLVRRFAPAHMRVFQGAAGPQTLGTETPASLAIAAALQREPLTILALGPATNIATVLKNHPSLAERVVSVIAVAGRRPGQRFTTGTINSRGYRDFNFESDPAAFQVILDSSVRLVLAPFELSSNVWITPGDLKQLERGSTQARWIARRSHGWLALWKKAFGVDGFNPFDTLAVARLAASELITCETLGAWIETLPDDLTERRMQGTATNDKPYLLVSASSSRPVEFCFSADSRFKQDLLRRLSRRPRL